MAAGDQGSPVLLGPWVALALALPAMVCALVVLTHQAPAGSIDDVFVVLVEARAWADGGGVNWGVSGTSTSVPGSGATSLLDVWVKAVGLWVMPQADPIRTAGWVAMGLCLGSGWVASAIALAWTGSVLAATVIALGVVLSPGLLESAGYLLEGPLFGLVWLLALGATMAGRWGLLAIGLTVLGLARPEGAVLAPWLGLLAKRPASDGRALVSPRGGLVGLAAAGAALLIRWLSTGHWLPTTYYAKASDSRWLEVLDGLGYVGQVLASAPGIALLSAAVAAWILSMGAEPKGRSRSQRLLCVACGYGLVVIVSGGDSYSGARLFMPVGLAVWLAVAASWPRSKGVSACYAAVAVATLLGVGTTQLDDRVPSAISSTPAILAAGPMGLEAFEADSRVFAALALALGPDEVFAHRHTQRFRWFEPDTRVLDLTGLTDRAVARRPAKGSVRFGRDAIDLALERRVGAMHLDPQTFRPRSIVDVGLVAALSDPEVAPLFGGEPFLAPSFARELAADYTGASRAGTGGVMNLLVRRDLGERFRAAGFRVGQ